MASLATLPARAGNVYVLSSGLASNDALVSAAVTNAGHAPTLGVQFTGFDGTQSLAGIDAVVLLANFNWNTGDMPAAGQTQLVNFVNAGGGLLTVEWLIYDIAFGAFAGLDPILPVTSDGAFNSVAATTLTQVTADAELNFNLPASFSVPLTDILGTESVFTPKGGATTYYSSSNGGGVADATGVVGWSVPGGRVLSLSTTAGDSSLADPSYNQLFQNSVEWVVDDESAPRVPLPASFVLLVAGIVSLPVLRRIRKTA